MPKLDVNVPPEFDFLFEVEPELVEDADAFEKFFADAGCSVNAEALAEESAARDAAFQKRFGAAPADSKLEKRASGSDDWADIVARANKITRDTNTVKAFDANGVLIGVRELEKTL
jgi:hypothetical protein